MASRVAKKPIALNKNVQVVIDGQTVSVKGPKGSLAYLVHPLVSVEQHENMLIIKMDEANQSSVAFAGTVRANLANCLTGVDTGFIKKLELRGVGYRAQMKGKSLSLALGFSHPVDFPVPEGIEIELPSATEIVVKGIDKQLVGQTAAKIRDFRPPEPYKGKGVRYVGEQVVQKEVKKK